MFSFFRNLWRHIVGDDIIHLAVIGIPSSGKSYLISDMIKSFASMGYNSYELVDNKMVYQPTSKYDADTRESTQTELYACRWENHYGTKMKKDGDPLKIDFLNIPGEVFSDEKAITLYFALSSKLRGQAGNRMFRLITWENSAGERKYVVEPRHMTQQLTDEIRDAKQNSYPQIDPESRKLNYMDWRQIFAELRAEGYHETSKSSNISGKKLLNNISNTVVDSAIASIGAVASRLHIEGIADHEDFRPIANAFYFMNYCHKATDMVVCDKMFLPEGDKGVKGNINFPMLCDQIVSFFNQDGQKKPSVYLAFRGADFLMQGKEEAYRSISKTIHNDPDTEDEDMEMRNAHYSMFSYLLWHHVYCNNSAPTDPLLDSKELLGFKPETNNIEQLKKKHLNIDSHSGRTIDGGSLQSTLKSHIGTTGNSFCKLLNYSYPDINSVPIKTGETCIVPHVYFTCTPITNDFVIYRNDPQKPNKFINDNEQGDARHFEYCGSHICFGSYQLCLDILAQHEKLDRAFYGELLAQTMNDQ